MSRLKGKIIRLEERIGARAPGVIIGHSREEVEAKLTEFKKQFPHALNPGTVLIAEPITKRPPDDCQDWAQDPGNFKKP